MAISKIKQLEIANVCYANVAGQFAMFNNPKYRGPNFKWENFADHCVKEADLWMILHNVYGSTKNKAEINQRAREYAKEIADRLVCHLTQ
jgi:hypothetical protein